MKVSIIGAGLAGSQAALSLADMGIEVELYEMKPHKKSKAHHLDDFAELVCSNSLKAKRINSASGLLKAEGLVLGASLLKIAGESALPAGGALAVDRETFARRITAALEQHPKITIHHEEVKKLPEARPLVLAAGPLAGASLLAELQEAIGQTSLAFFDAAAPILEAASIDPDLSFRQSRYDRGDDYINCPMDKETYEHFYAELVAAKRADLKDFDKKQLFQGCQPIEQIAETGIDSLRFGPLKPVGLEDPVTGKRPYANVQLRQENFAANLYNMVGFQTQLSFTEQRRVFRLIPALHQAEFVRYGVMHKNAFIDAPSALGYDFQLKALPGVYVIGQLSGLEGYVPAILSGQMVAIQLALRVQGHMALRLDRETMWGALVEYMTTPQKDYQPMTANFGLLPPLETRVRGKQERYQHYADRALLALQKTLEPLRAHLSCLRPMDDAYIIDQID